MENFEIIKSGYAIKSPPADRENHTWRKRFCALFYQELSNRKHYFFRYYENEKKMMNKRHPIKSFDLTDCKIAKIPNGIRTYNYVIKLFLSERYENRELYLCLDNKDEMESWYDAVTTSLKKVNQPIEREEEIQEQDPNSPMRREIERVRSKIYEENFRKSKSSTTLDDNGSFRSSVASSVISEEQLDYEYSSTIHGEKHFQYGFKSNGNKTTDSGFSNDSNLSFEKENLEA